MIVTVTANAAVDKTLTVANLQLGHRHRAPAGVAQAGGKGINVARVFINLGEPVIATGLAGGRAGSQILESMDTEGLIHDFVRIDAESRTSTAVIDPTSGVETEINEYGPEVSDEELGRLQERLRYLSKAAWAVVLAGSLPRKVPTSFYADVVRDLTKRKVLVVVDADGEPMRLALAAGPALVSPNQREAEALVGHEFSTDEDFQQGLHEIADMGAERVLITLKTGCYALLRSNKHHDRLFRAWIPRQETVSSVGSGDALLAGFLAGWQAEESAEQCLRRALACGAANTQTVGAGVFDSRDVARFAGLVEVQEIQPNKVKAS